MKKLIVLSLSILFICMNASFAKDKDSTYNPSAKNIVYVETALFHLVYVFSGHVSLNYERIIDNWLSVRVGYGISENISASLGGSGSSDDIYHGISLITNFQNNTGNHKLNFGIGVSYIDHLEKIEKWKLFPALCITYRFQPLRGGFYFSTGITLAYGAVGNSLGAGYIF